jgi:excisionase family DNA binding protein
MEGLVSVEQAAETLGISPWTLRLYLRKRLLRPVRIGRRVLIEPAELRRFVEAAKQLSIKGESV